MSLFQSCDVDHELSSSLPFLSELTLRREAFRVEDASRGIYLGVSDVCERTLQYDGLCALNLSVTMGRPWLWGLEEYA